MPDTTAENPLTHTPVYSATEMRTYTGSDGDYLDAGSLGSLDLRSGTVSLSFALDRLPGDMALISRDGADRGAGGGFTVWVKDGTLLVTQESATETEYLKVPDLVLSANQTYHFAMSFGADGLSLWLDGVLVASEPDFMQGMHKNDSALVVGGTRAWRSSDSDPAHSLFKGTIGDVMVFDKQLGEADMIALAGAVDPALGMAASMQAGMADLAPVLRQMHHASDTLRDILDDYGVDGHGHPGTPLKMISRGAADNKVVGGAADDGINGGRGDDVVRGEGGADVLQGDYGNDKVYGGKGRDILDGGHGEDRLWGGNGDDLLISRADAREPRIFFDPDRDEGDPLGELTRGKLYPGQPIPGDDVLTGGRGADVFYFQTLINAKERYLRKHTRDDGSINWHGVAGENDKLHDHWVDHLGRDVVMDYSRAEGDRLVIEGHTTEIGSITYGDSNKDGVMDYSVISLYSDQGSGGGAHNDDRLGSIKVYGDLVKRSDIEHTSKPAYGIINTIADLKEALRPTDIAADTGNIRAPKSLPNLKDLDITTSLKPVFAATGAHDFDPEDRAPLVFDHGPQLSLAAGTIAFSFRADTVTRFQALMSKDASDYGGGGHIAAYLTESGGLVVRMQSKTESHYFEVANAIKPGVDYDFALSFGADGAELFLNGARVAKDNQITLDLTKNTESLVFGATGWSNSPGKTDNIHSHFDGTIRDVMIFDSQMTGDAIFGSSARSDFAYMEGRADSYLFAKTAGGVVTVTDGLETTRLDGAVEFVSFSDVTVRLTDIQFGAGGNDAMTGSDGSDVLFGKGGDDNLSGRRNDDRLFGGNGDDRLYGGDGNDFLFGNDGDDKAFGGDDADRIWGGDGHDDLYGEGGNDVLYGGLGDDDLFGHTWNDSGRATKDKAVFDGDFADFSFETASWYDSNRGKVVKQLIVTDSADGGSDGYYEGRDRLMDIDLLVFADQMVEFDILL